MKTLRIKFLTTGLAVLVATAGQARATLLTFDDVPGGSVQNSYGDMPTYQGFNFSSTLDWIDTVASSVNFGAHSGEFTLLNNRGGTGLIVDAGGADFTFDGVWAKTWGTAPESGGANSLFGTISGWNNGVQVWSAITGLNGSFQFFGAQAGAIDELQLGFGNYFLVDDLSLNVAPVPEPSTYLAGVLLLLPFGLQGFRWLRNRQQVA